MGRSFDLIGGSDPVRTVGAETPRRIGAQNFDPINSDVMAADVSHPEDGGGKRPPARTLELLKSQFELDSRPIPVEVVEAETQCQPCHEFLRFHAKQSTRPTWPSLRPSQS